MSSRFRQTWEHVVPRRIQAVAAFIVGSGLVLASACAGESQDAAGTGGAGSGSPGSTGTGGVGQPRPRPGGVVEPAVGGVADPGAGAAGEPSAGASGGPGIVPQKFTLTVDKTEGGKVTSTPAGDIDCGSSCGHTYLDSGTAATVSLTATPDRSVEFGGWGGDCTGTGACVVTMDADRTVSATFKSLCPAVEPLATYYVDHTSGTDDALHGGASGSCAAKTLSYALTKAKGAIHLAGADTFPGNVPGEETPYALVGQQQLVCNNALFTWPGEEGSYWGLVAITGVANKIDGCRINGASNGGYCALIATTGAHVFSNNTVTACANVAVHVSTGVKGTTFSGNHFSANGNGIFFEGSNAGQLIENSMVSLGWDVYCTTPNLELTGASNIRGGGSLTCVDCANCPF